MARRRNLKDLLTPDPTPDKQLAHPSGWCMTMSHEFCPYQFAHGKCGCSCHTKPKLVNKEPNTVSDDKPKRGRPKGSVNKTKEVSKSETKGDTMTLDPRPWKR
jgi:hypothetical protein